MEQNRPKDGMDRYVQIGLTVFSVIAASMLLFFCILRWGQLMSLVKRVLKILQPFIYGAVIAYLLNPVFNVLQKHLYKITIRLFHKSPKRAKNISKICSSFISVVLALAFIYAMFALIVPELYTSITKFADGFSGNVEMAEKWLRDILDKYPDIEPTIMNYYDTLVNMAENWLTNTLLPGAGVLFNNVTNGLAAMFNLLYNLFIGIIVAIYLLNEKEILLPQCKKLIYGILKKEHAGVVLAECAYADEMFSGFVYGKIIDSVIVGLICFIAGTILQLPYIAMVSVVVGVTNVIPFFGPYIGGIPSALIILLASPIKCVQFVIMIVILQQFDGNYLGPKILGNTTGVSSFWVLFSILFFGGLWGLPGMIVGIPLFAVIYHIVTARVNASLRNKGMAVELTAYKPVQQEKDSTSLEKKKGRKQADGKN